MSDLKWTGKSRDKIEGLLAPFGGPDFLAGKDFQGEYFSPNTDFHLEWFGDWERPLLYNHGLDDTVGPSVVGRIKVKQTDKGLWMQAQLDKAHDYYDKIAALVDEKALGLSSGSVGHLVEVDRKSGEIKSWPLIEGSTTPTPANPDAKAGYEIKSAEAVEHLAVLGVEAPEAIKSDDDEPELEDEPATKAGRVLSKANEDDMAAAMAALESAMERMHAVMGRAMPQEDMDEDHKSMDTPQALHDAAVASGAACAPSETKVSEPAPLLAIAGKSAETKPELDLVALKARFSAEAVAAAKELLDN